MIEHAAAVEVRAAGRTLTGTGMRYGAVAPGFREMFEPGGLVEMREPFPLVMQHDTSLVVATTADALRVADTPKSFEARAELAEGSAALTLVRSRALTGFSVGFVAHREHRNAQGLRVVERYSYDHLGLVDRPAYPDSTVEVRARNALARVRSYVPANRKVSCRCSGAGCKFAEMMADGLKRAMDRAFARAAELIDVDDAADAAAAAGTVAGRADDFIACFGSFDRPLASVSRGTLRRDPDDPLGFVIDLPDDDNGRATLAAHEAAGVIVRPHITNAEGAVQDGDTMRYEGDFDIAALVVSSTDARDGWPTPELVGTESRQAPREAPSGLLRLL